jgi:hypothetical protein
MPLLSDGNIRMRKDDRGEGFEPGSIAGTICTPLAPFPITATVLSLRSKEVSYAAICINFPSKSCKPGISGQTHALPVSLHIHLTPSGHEGGKLTSILHFH